MKTCVEIIGRKSKEEEKDSRERRKEMCNDRHLDLLPFLRGGGVQKIPLH